MNDLLQDWDDEVLRREFLTSTGIVGATIATGLGAGGATGGRERLDAHIALRAAHGRLDNLLGPSAVFTQAVEHHQQILAWLATARTTSERQRISALAADTGGFVGYLTYDMGRVESAVRHYRDATAHAHQAGDLSSCIYLIGQMSRVFADQGHYRRAFTLTDGALRLGGTKAHPAVRSWLHAVRAHHHACLNDARDTQIDLTAAWTLLGRADDGEIPPYVGYLDPPEIQKWTGHAMNRLGQTTPSYLRLGKSALDDARAAWPASSVRGSAELLSVSSRIHAACGDRDAATDLATRSIAIATTTGSMRNLRAALTAQAFTISGP